MARRGGKSSAAGIMLLWMALTFPKTTSVFCALTMETAQKIIKEILEMFQHKFNLQFTMLSKQINFPNGSIIYFMGIDAAEKQRAKFKGWKPKLVVIDECQDINVDLESAINNAIGPALIDNDGTLVLLGCPDDIQNTYFYELTKDYNPGGLWTFHSWEASKNTAIYNGRRMCDRIQEDIDKNVKANPNFKDTPTYKQQYLGKWATQSEFLVYHKFNEINFIIPDRLIQSNFAGYNNILACDLGFRDNDSFLVLSWSLDDPNLYVRESHKRPGNDLFHSAEFIHQLKTTYNFLQIVIDTTAKDLVTLQNRKDLPELVQIEKGEKMFNISLLNADIDAGRIRICEPARPNLEFEMNRLILDKAALKKGRRKELEGLPNDCLDCLLYGWRASRNYLYTPPPVREVKTEEERMNEMIIAKRIRQGSESDFDTIENSLFDWE